MLWINTMLKSLVGLSTLLWTFVHDENELELTQVNRNLIMFKISVTKINLINKSNSLSPHPSPHPRSLLYLTLNGNCCSMTQRHTTTAPSSGDGCSRAPAPTTPEPWSTEPEMLR